VCVCVCWLRVSRFNDSKTRTGGEKRNATLWPAEALLALLLTVLRVGFIYVGTIYLQSS